MLAFEISLGDLDTLIIHPPPYNIFSIVLIFLIPFKNLRKKVSLKIDSLVYWIDNILISLIQMALELAILPICYFKILGLLFVKLWRSRCWLLACVTFWIFLGPVCLLFFVVTDIISQIKLMISNSQADLDEDDFAFGSEKYNLSYQRAMS